MIVAVSHFEWQLIRYIARTERAGDPSPFGRDLRVSPTRRTKDGTFLDALVERGLLAVAGKAPPLPAGAGPAERGEAIQFRTRYKLTDAGRHAAEYGEYDRPFTPGEVPVTGMFAAVLAARGGKKPGKKK